jgi:hypothetical protein
MGRNLEDFLRSAEEGGSDLWHKLRAQAAAGTRDDYQRGRQVYDDAVRTGQDVVARTPTEVAHVGRAANAAVRAAGNGASLGAADVLEAGTEALFGMGGSGGFRQRYQRQLALQRQADADAQREFPNLYKWGGRAGALAGILALDGPAAAAGLARVAPGGAKVYEAIQGFRPIGFIPQGYGRMAGAIGGAVNTGAQVANDALHGRQTSLSDAADAFVGGAIGTAAAVRGRPVLGGAIGSGVTTGLQEADRGRASADDVLNSGLQGAYWGRGFSTLGEQISNALPMKAKQGLGEGLTFLKSWARGEPISPWEVDNIPAIRANLPSIPDATAGPQIRIPLSNGRTTIADWTTLWGRALEAKFGLSAELRRGQRIAPRDLYPNYLPDHWSPGNVGDMAGGAFGSMQGLYDAGNEAP